MKVLYKPQLKTQKCAYCGSLLKINYRDLQTDGLTFRKDVFYCKVCKGKNLVLFDKGE